MINCYVVARVGRKDMHSLRVGKGGEAPKGIGVVEAACEAALLSCVRCCNKTPYCLPSREN